MCYGTPVVTSAVAGIADLVERGECGVVFDLITPASKCECRRPREPAIPDERAVVRHITELLLDTQLRSRTGKRAAEVIERELSPVVIGMKWAKMLQEML
jgi:glycosyltransferase involved in cell wall biosynthesis